MIPWHSRQEQAHAAVVGYAGEDQARADEGGDGQKQGMNSPRQERSKKDERPGGDADLADDVLTVPAGSALVSGSCSPSNSALVAGSYTIWDYADRPAASMVITGPFCMNAVGWRLASASYGICRRSSMNSSGNCRL